jgi:RNA polymerase sigma-32 factor
MTAQKKKKNAKKNTSLEPEVVDREEQEEQDEPEEDLDSLEAGEGDDDDEKGEHLPLLLPTTTDKAALRDPLHLYLREVSRFPLLQPEEEFQLAQRVRESGDSDAAFRLISSHLRLVVKIAMDFQRRWMQNVLDLIQEGNVGLMRAVQKFDPDKGIKFSYYASFWIKAYILKFIMDNWRLVKIGTTQAQRKLFYNLNKERQRLQAQGFDPDTSTLSKNLNVSEEQVLEMEQRLSSGDMSLDTTIADDSNTTRMDFLPALGPGVEETMAQGEISSKLQEHLETILPELNDKEVDILRYRLLSDQPLTLREIGEKYDITRERVRQLEARLLQKLRAHLTENIDDFSPEWIEQAE